MPKKYLNFSNIFILGVASGLPLALVFSTLSIWLKELGISKTAIGLFAFTSTPYTLKFLWSPLIDGLKIPYLTNKLGKRRSWLFVTQLFLFLSLFLLSISSPDRALLFTALMTLTVSFCSATQDIVIDAYRIEVLKEDEQGLGATLIVYGYRVGMLISSAGALVLAEYLGFVVSYQVMAALFLIFAFFTLFISRPDDEKDLDYKNYNIWLKQYVFDPFKDFIKRKDYLWIIAFIIFYKFGDAFAGVMTGPFLIELGFAKTEIAFFVKTIGLFATLAGSLCGALLCKYCSFRKSLLIAGILQLLTNLVFCLQAYVGKSNILLGFTIASENLAGGIGTIVFVAYISSLCNINFTATQYALLSSLSAVARTWLSTSSGFIADQVNWIEFFAFSALLAVPGLVFIFFIKESKQKV